MSKYAGANSASQLPSTIVTVLKYGFAVLINSLYTTHCADFTDDEGYTRALYSSTLLCTLHLIILRGQVKAVMIEHRRLHEESAAQAPPHIPLHYNNMTSLQSPPHSQDPQTIPSNPPCSPQSPFFWERLSQSASQASHSQMELPPLETAHSSPYWLMQTEAQSFHSPGFSSPSPSQKGANHQFPQHNTHLHQLTHTPSLLHILHQTLAHEVHKRSRPLRGRQTWRWLVQYTIHYSRWGEASIRMLLSHLNQ